MCARFFISSASIGMVQSVCAYSIQYSVKYGLDLTFAKLTSSPLPRRYSFLPHFAVSFQNMLPSFTKVDLFLNIISTTTTTPPAKTTSWIAVAVLCCVATYFYLSRHFNLLRFSCAQTQTHRGDGRQADRAKVLLENGQGENRKEKRFIEMNGQNGKRERDAVIFYS